MATLIENAAAVKSAAIAIDAAIVAKGGATAGGLANAAAAIAALPSGGEDYWGISLENNRANASVDYVCSATTINGVGGTAFRSNSDVRSLTFPNLRECSRNEVFYNLNYCTELNFPALRSVLGNRAFGAFYQTVEDTASSFPVLEELGEGVFWQYGSHATLLKNYNFTLPALKRITGKHPWQEASITELNLPELISAYQYLLHETSKLITFRAPKLTVFVSPLSGSVHNVIRDLFLNSIEYMGESMPSGFPWNIGTQATFHFANNTTVAYVNGAWTIVED